MSDETKVADEADVGAAVDDDVDDVLDDKDEPDVDTVDDDVDDLEARVAPRMSAAERRQRQMSIAALATILAFGLIILAVVILKPGKSSTPKAPPPAPKTPAIATFTDTADHFKLSYPGSWMSQPPADPAVKLYATFGANGLDVLLVRVTPLATSVNASNINNIKSVTDAIISGANVKILEQRGIQIGGLQGYDYFYTYPDKGTTIIHSHIFVFPPNQMVEVVFQTRQDQFASFATDISNVLASFHTI